MQNLRLTLAVLFVLSACVQAPMSQNPSQALPAQVATANSQPLAARFQRPASRALLGNGKIQHVVIIIQENRSVDNLFNGLPGADTVTEGLNTDGKEVKLQSASLVTTWDTGHSHAQWNLDYDGGKMDGFNLENSRCHGGAQCFTPGTRSYTMVQYSEVQPYFSMAEQYSFADRMFATQAGPSFPAHQYLFTAADNVSPSSTLRAADNPLDPNQKFTGGCDSPPGSIVLLIDAHGTENQLDYPCFDRPALPDLVDAAGLTWRYYSVRTKAGLWSAPDAIKHIRDSSGYSQDVVGPPARVLTDIKNDKLANVVWVTPSRGASDHPGTNNGSGPSWVSSVVNAIGGSSYWSNTAIFVVWDDWGGLYDHVKPHQFNSFELGFRVPLIVISPYAKQGYVSHAQHEFGSILKFTEQVFNLGSLGATDVRADNLSDCFSFGAKPRKFVRIKAPLGAQYFLNQPPDDAIPDDD